MKMIKIGVLSLLTLFIIASGTVIADSKTNVLTKVGEIIKNESMDTRSNIKDMNPLNDEIDNKRHDFFVLSLIEEKGYNAKEAREEAIDIQIRNVALIQEANDRGIQVTEQEALKESKEQRDQLEKGLETDGKNAEYVYNRLKQFIEGLEITEDQYWNEYVINSYKEKLLIEKLSEEILENETRVNAKWKEFVEKTIDDFKDENEIESILK